MQCSYQGIYLDSFLCVERWGGGCEGVGELHVCVHSPILVVYTAIRVIVDIQLSEYKADDKKNFL